jgi:hypothetical protein
LSAGSSDGDREPTLKGKLFLLAVSALLLISQACAGPSAGTTARLTIEGATCSGTVVAPSTILSAAHCFKDPDEDELDKALGHAAPLPSEMLIDGYRVYIEAVSFDDNDHALVRVSFNFHERATLGPVPAVGAHVHYWGNPGGLVNAYREGYVSSYHNGEMILDVNGFFGDSGAGIFDESGKLVGVMSSLHGVRRQGIIFKLMGVQALEFTPLQYEMMGVTPP